MHLSPLQNPKRLQPLCFPQASGLKPHQLQPSRLPDVAADSGGSCKWSSRRHRAPSHVLGLRAAALGTREVADLTEEPRAWGEHFGGDEATARGGGKSESKTLAWFCLRSFLIFFYHFCIFLYVFLALERGLLGICFIFGGLLKQIEARDQRFWSMFPLPIGFLRVPSLNHSQVGVADGDEVTAVVGQRHQIAATLKAFACLKGDGSVETWGPEEYHGLAYEMITIIYCVPRFNFNHLHFGVFLAIIISSNNSSYYKSQELFSFCS